MVPGLSQRPSTDRAGFLIWPDEQINLALGTFDAIEFYSFDLRKHED